MSQVSCLDKLITRINETVFKSTGAEELVIIDRKTLKAVASKGFLQKVNYYLVKNNNNTEHHAQCVTEAIAIQDFPSSRRIDISIVYRVYCPPGNETRVAEALCILNPPQAALNQLIRRWVVEFTNGREADFIENCDERKRDLFLNLRDRALHEVGLILDARLSVDNNKIAKHSIKKKSHLILLKDSDHKYDLEITADLEVDPAKKMLANLSHKTFADFEKQAVFIIDQYCVKHVSVHELFMGLELNRGSSTEPHKNVIRDQLNKMLAQDGRRIGALQLAMDTQKFSVKTFFEHDFSIPCDLGQYPETVNISNRVQLKLVDIGKYHLKSSPDLRSWVGKTLERIIHSELFSSEYLDVLLRFDKLEQAIKIEMQKQVAFIGYELQHLITVPDLEPLTWRHPFSIKFKEKTFATKVTGYNVGLKIIVKASIPDLNEVEYHLNRQENLPKLMKTNVKQVVEDFVHKIEPERFYMRFYHGGEEGEVAVNDELTDNIRSSLTKNFHAEVLDIVIKPLPTDITLRLEKLRARDEKIQLTVNAFKTFESVEFNGKFKVEGVHQNGWFDFQSKKSDLKEIATFIEEQIKNKLKTWDLKKFRFRDEEHAELLIELLNDFIKKKVAAHFGIVVSLFSFSREKTNLEKKLDQHKEFDELDQIGNDLEIEQKQRETEKTLQLNSIDEKLEIQEKLKDKYLRQIEYGADEVELEELETWKNSLTKNLSPPKRTQQKRKIEKLEAELNDTSGGLKRLMVDEKPSEKASQVDRSDGK